LWEKLNAVLIRENRKKFGVSDSDGRKRKKKIKGKKISTLPPKKTLQFPRPTDWFVS
jgi:hypothetical protein